MEGLRVESEEAYVEIVDVTTEVTTVEPHEVGKIVDTI